MTVILLATLYTAISWLLAKAFVSVIGRLWLAWKLLVP